MDNNQTNTNVKTDVEKQSDIKVFLFHPTAVIVLILLDWGGFLFEVPQLWSLFTMILTGLGIFTISGGLIYALQRHFTLDDKRAALIKGVLGGLICAIPAPVMASFVGSIILTLSGFENIKQFGFEGLMKMFDRQKK